MRVHVTTKTEKERRRKFIASIQPMACVSVAGNHQKPCKGDQMTLPCNKAPIGGQII